MSDKKPRIAIIGGGPAGATASLLLTKSGIDHTLFDKEVFPRDKTCGDGLTMEVYRTLNEIDPALAKEFANLDFVEEAGGMFASDWKGRELTVDYRVEGGVAPIFVAKRELFDDWLFQKTKDSSYATIKEGVGVDDIQREGKGFILKTTNGEEYFDFLLGCDGERSLVKKKFTTEGIKKVREHHAAAIRVYYKNVAPIKDFKPLEFYLLNEFQGYFWIFHLPNGECNVGFGALSEEVSNKKLNLKKEMFKFIENHKELKKRFANAEMLGPVKGWGIPLNSNKIDYCGDGFLLIGDSASMAEPATGKGIGIAMFISFMSIPIIKKAIEENDFSKEKLLAFQEVVLKKFGKEWESLYKVSKNLSKSWIQSVIFLFANIPYLNKRYGRKTGERIQRFVQAKGW